MSTTAPILIVNAKILTMDPDNPHAEAVLLKDGRIVAIGGRAEVEAQKTSDTKVLDAGGKTVLPGFSENHLHLFSGAAELDHMQLTGVHGFDDLKKAVEAYAGGRSKSEKLLYGQGCDYTILGEGQRLTRQHLDRILPDRPLILFAHDHHTAWANTAALELGGILHGKTLGPNNEIVMADDGTASGELREGEAFGPITEAAGPGRHRLGLMGLEPDPYPVGDEFEKDIRTIRLGLDYCARHGFTSLQCMDGNLYQLQLLSEIERRDGFLPLRVQIPFHLKNFMPLSELDRASHMTATYTSDFLSSGLVKIFYDGVLDSWTAIMVEPYANKPDSTGGESLFTPEEFNKAATEIDRRGLQIAVHAIGDGAVRAVLNGYEAARKANGARDSRHRIEHIEVVHPADIPRFRELGVVASMQPPHPPGAMGLPLEPTVSMIGRDRWPYAYAWRTLKEAGARIPFASDWPVSPIDPLEGIQAAVTRQKWQDSDPDQSFSLMEAIAAYTSEGAYAEFAEDRKGMLKAGYFADVTVLDADIEAVDPHEIHAIKPAKVICGGRLTFEA